MTTPFIIFDAGRPSHIISTRDEAAALIEAHRSGSGPAGLSARPLADYVQQVDRESTRAGLPFALIVGAVTGAEDARIDADGRVWAPLAPAVVLDVLRAWHG